ncbi:MAG: HAD family phosphatase [Proteobacteria bacterium]|nr:HAD family phosphatase [Pseudomonadota bacterium]
MKTRHVIFDCDGTLVDSETLSMRSDVTILARCGLVISEEEAHRRFVGRTFNAMLDELAAEHGIAFPPGLNEVKNRMMEELYPTELRAVPGLSETLALLRDRGLGMSVGSNSPSARIELALKVTGIAPFFSHYSSPEHVAEGKPAPDIFLRCARLAGAQPADCVVIEDSITGVSAAMAAGIPVIGYVGTHPDKMEHGAVLKAHGAFTIIQHMSELPGQIA